MSHEIILRFFLIPLTIIASAFLVSPRALTLFKLGILELRVNPQKWFDVLKWLIVFVGIECAVVCFVLIVSSEKVTRENFMISIRLFDFAAVVSGICVGVVSIALRNNNQK